MNDDFGNFVKSLRKQRTFFDEEGYLRQWTQAKLAEASGLTTAQISKIEQGRLSHLTPALLNHLTTALQLTEVEKTAFFARAGLVYQARQNTANLDRINAVLEMFDFPAAAYTAVWDMIAVNSLNNELWGYTPQILKLLDTGELGANLLRVMFDKNIKHYQWVPPGKELAAVVWMFRTSSSRYADTKRYRQVINELKKLGREFDMMWDLSEHLFGDGSETLSPMMHIDHPELGRMTFISLSLPRRYLGESVVISVYVPTPDSEDQFQLLKKKARGNRIHFFRPVAVS